MIGWLLLGMVIGAVIGFMTCALVSADKRDDKED